MSNRYELDDPRSKLLRQSVWPQQSPAVLI